MSSLEGKIQSNAIRVGQTMTGGKPIIPVIEEKQRFGVLIIEDDFQLSKIVEAACIGIGFFTRVANSIADARGAIAEFEFHAAVLDLGLPDGNGIDFCRELRANDPDFGILILTSFVGESDKVKGLNAGADDYLGKPFGARELVARLNALFRRINLSRGGKANPLPDEDEIISFGHLVVNLTLRRVEVRGEAIDLPAVEYDILALLISNPGVEFSRDALLGRVWGVGGGRFDSTINSHVSRLRSKIEPNRDKPRFILTVHGCGYRFTTLRELQAAGIE